MLSVSLSSKQPSRGPRRAPAARGQLDVWSSCGHGCSPITGSDTSLMINYYAGLLLSSVPTQNPSNPAAAGRGTRSRAGRDSGLEMRRRSVATSDLSAWIRSRRCTFCCAQLLMLLHYLCFFTQAGVHGCRGVERLQRRC